MRKYCVYCHINNVNGKRYVGITAQKPENRWQNGHGYDSNKRFRNAIKKYGWENFDHKILFTGLKKKEAELIEIELIKKWDLTNRANGYNVSPGGNLHKPLSKKSKSKISKSLKETYKNTKHPCYGRPMSPYCKTLMSAANEARKKKVLQFTIEGLFLREYESMRALERATGFHRAAIKDNIIGKSKQSYGYVWRFKEDKNR